MAAFALALAAALTFGPVWQQKIRTAFARYDLNGDGQITAVDHTIMVQRFNAIVYPTQQQFNALSDGGTLFWNDFFSWNPPTVDANTYVAAIQAKGKTALAPLFHDVYSYFFEAIDGNDDGEIDPAEYKLYNQVLSIDAASSTLSFNCMDTNDDGVVSKPEYLVAVQIFYCTDSVSPFMGPLAAIPG
jgi:Ca2+-binding EF-hand superfamily protein